MKPNTHMTVNTSAILLTLIVALLPVATNAAWDRHDVETSFNAAVGVSACDFDNDSLIDIVATNHSQRKIVAYFNSGDGTFTPDTVHQNSDHGLKEVCAADIDDDGHCDFVTVVDSENEVVWWKNDGTGSFSRIQIDNTLNWADNLEIGDVDNNGLLDIVGSGRNERALYLQTSPGSFTKSIIHDGTSVVSVISLVDFDGTNGLDMILTDNENNSLKLYLNDGSENFGLVATIPIYDAATDVRAADIDEDGDLDIVATEFSGNYIAWYEDTGSYSFSGPNYVDSSIDSPWKLLIVDIDSDGHLDVVTGQYYTGGVWWWKNDGTGSFSAGNAIDTGSIGKYLCFEDIDNDGVNDILCAGGSYVSWWKNPHYSTDFTTADTLGCEPHTACFTNASTGTIDSVLWDFGDGGTSSEGEPCYEYTECGTYDVTLIVWGPGGSDTLTKANYVEIQCKPTAAFSYTPTEIYVDSSVQFVDESTGDPMPESWLWDFGDGDTSTEQSPEHVYTEAGEFIVTLIAENTCGPDTTVDTVEVLDNEPADSLILPSVIAQPCDDECAAQPVQVVASQDLGGVTIPIAIPDSVTICDLSTAGLPTESWDFQTLDIQPDSGFIFISLFNTQGLVIDSGTTTVANIYFNAPRQCSETPGENANSFIHWDTTLSDDPSRALLFSDPGGTEEIHPGFDPNRDSTEIVDFLMGDCDNSGTLDIADLVCMVAYMFQGGDSPSVMASLNVNGIGGTAPNISDLVYLVAYMFQGGPAPVCPEPSGQVARLTPSGDVWLASAYDAISTRVTFSAPSPLLGVQLELMGTGNGEPVSRLQNDNIEVVHGREGDRMKVGILDMQGAHSIEAGEHVLIEIPGQWEIVSALAADQNFQTIQPSLGRIEPELPKEFSLGQNYPNPFNPTTEINFALPTACDVSLEIYNITGQRVTTLIDSYLEAGQHSVLWDASSNASGVYFYRLNAGEFTETKKMMLLK